MGSGALRVARMAGLALLAALAVGVARAVRSPGKPKPTGTANWPPLIDRPEPTRRSGPVRFAMSTPTTTENTTTENTSTPDPEPAISTGDQDETAAGSEPTSATSTDVNTRVDSGATTQAGVTGSGVATSARWVEPIDNRCPIDHPIKVTDKSSIFHAPGGAFYDRVVAWRCYATPPDAEQDGYRASKR